MDNKEKQEIALLGRLFSLEVFLFLAGIVLLISGMVTGAVMQLFYGGVITIGSVALYFVRKKDWKKHWEEQEMLRQMYEQRERERKEKEKEKENNGAGNG